MGSSAEALWFGLPTVAIRRAVDQFANAATLGAIGAGVLLPAEQLSACVDLARSRSYRG